MFRFFKNLRLSFINQGFKSNSKLSKYLTYAFGEIILVVLGILIALQINTWNQNQQDKQQLKDIVLKIKQNLSSDLAIANNIISSFKYRDSISQLIFSGAISAETFNSIRADDLPFASMVLELNTNGYKQLTNQIDKVPNEYNPLLEVLNSIYIDTKSNLDLNNRQMDETIQHHIDYLAQHKPWFSNWMRGYNSKEAIEYFMTDSLAHNQTSLYLAILESLTQESMVLKLRSIEAIRLINNINENEHDFHVASTIHLNDTSIVKALTGTYKIVRHQDASNILFGKTFTLQQEENALKLIDNDQESFNLYWCYGQTFYSRIGYISFYKDSSANVLMQIQRTSGYVFLTQQK